MKVHVLFQNRYFTVKHYLFGVLRNIFGPFSIVFGKSLSLSLKVFFTVTSLCSPNDCFLVI